MRECYGQTFFEDVTDVPPAPCKKRKERGTPETWSAQPRLQLEPRARLAWAVPGTSSPRKYSPLAAFISGMAA
jgi:hypothetical protein